jgi:hypothetical protein
LLFWQTALEKLGGFFRRRSERIASRQNAVSRFRSQLVTAQTLKIERTAAART